MLRHRTVRERMRTLALLTLVLPLGSPARCADMPTLIARAPPPDLAALWELARVNNPTLREAEAEVEAARGQLIQAGKYPNPRLSYRESVLGTPQAQAGDLAVEATQEILTRGKRRLDVAIATRGLDAAGVALLNRRFDVLTRIRRAYYDYLGWAYTERVSAQMTAGLRQGVEITRRQVEEAKIRPRTDLLRLQAVLDDAVLTQRQARTGREAAWRQLAAEVGVPDLPLPEVLPDPANGTPDWQPDAVLRRVLAVNTELQAAAVQTERARLEVERARAEAVPNVTVGGGYSNNFPERQQGGTLTLETPLPLWDRKQGRIHEAQARWARAQAAERSAATRLAGDTAEAFGRYQSARQRVEQLAGAIVPRLEESVGLVRRGYQTGAPQITFADVLLAEQTLNDARLRLAAARRDLGRALADLQGLMQLDVTEELDGRPDPCR
jgi:cobalt-zinc-cadmium efflux system outer membrane protein